MNYARLLYHALYGTEPSYEEMSSGECVAEGTHGKISVINRRGTQLYLKRPNHDEIIVASGSYNPWTVLPEAYLVAVFGESLYKWIPFLLGSLMTATLYPFWKYYAVLALLMSLILSQTFMKTIAWRSLHSGKWGAIWSTMNAFRATMIALLTFSTTLLVILVAYGVLEIVLVFARQDALFQSVFLGLVSLSSMMVLYRMRNNG